jgi:outer membrane protein OmpA-like peptidoglycan-associated protein
MNWMSKCLCCTVAFVAVAASATPVDAQGVLGRLRDRAKQKVEDKATEQVDKTVDKATGSVPAAGEASGSATVAGSPSAKPGEGAWVNFDFVPGSRPLFVTDFTSDKVGDFPRRLEFMDGNIEVAEWQGSRWLRTTSWPGGFAVPLPEVLPERFTIEFDATPGYHNNWLIMHFADGAADDVRFRAVNGRGQGGVFGAEHQTQGETPARIEPGQVFRARIMADGDYVKVYMDDARVANIPNAKLGRSNKIVFEVAGHNETPVFIGNLRVMAGGADLYEELSDDGRVATQGILFDTNSDRIRPESTPTLKEIAGMLKEHGDLRIAIEGHTDNVGQDAANQQLSEKRAAAVKAWLVEQGIEAGRLESKGLGASKPAAGNDTPEGRQQNRRVELVRL